MNRRAWFRTGWTLAACGIIVPKIMPLLGERIYRPNRRPAAAAAVRLLDADGHLVSYRWMEADLDGGYTTTFQAVEGDGTYLVVCEMPMPAAVRELSPHAPAMVRAKPTLIVPTGGDVIVRWPGVITYWG